MPMARALKLCPNAVVLKPDMAKYSAVSKQIRERMFALTPLVEPMSIDEAFLDLTGCEAALGMAAAPALARFAAAVEREIGVTVSIGLSYCKFLAKFASDLDKPKGFSAIARDEAIAAARAARRQPAVGRRRGGAAAAGAPRRSRSSATCSGSTKPTPWRGSARTGAGCGGCRAGSTSARCRWTARPRAFPPRRRSSTTSRSATNWRRSCSASARRSRAGSRRRNLRRAA